MDCLQLINQNIMTKDQSTSFIYKLTHGTANIINQDQQPVKTLQSPYYLNIVQSLYSVPTLKTIQAVGKCQIKKIAVKQSHKLLIKDLKEKGVRKSKFQVFEEMHSSKFYELVRLGVLLQFRKGQQFGSKNQHFYFVVSGSIIAYEKENNLKMFRLEQGSIWCSGQNNTVFRSEVDQTKLIEIGSDIVYCILHEKEAELIELAKFQSQTIQNFKQRNQRVEREIKRSKQKRFTKLVMSKNFANSMEFRCKKASNLSKCMKAKSCYMQENGEFKKPAQLIQEIKKENTVKFMELMEINKKKLRKNQLFCKSIDKLYSLSCTATPESNSPKGKTSMHLISKPQSQKSQHSLQNINVNYSRSHFAQTVSQILNKKQSGHLKKHMYSRTGGKITFPQEKSRKNSSQSMIIWKIT